MGTKISEIATEQTSPGNDDRMEISKLVSISPVVWDTEYIKYSTFKGLFTLQSVSDEGASTTNTISILKGNDENALFVVGSGDSLNKVAINNNADDSGQILVYDETETATINLNGYTGDVSSDSVTTSQVIISAETASTIASFDGSKKIKSLSTSTYPSLTELAYVKGVTSGIQTQIDAINSNTNWIYSLKITTGDQSTTSNVAGNITDLIYAVAINSVYTFQGAFKISCSSTGGVKFAIVLPTGATMWMNWFGSTTSNTVVAFQNSAVSGTLISTAYCQEAQSREVLINGTITTAGTSGNVQFQFASGTNTQTSTIYQEGTYLRIQKVA